MDGRRMDVVLGVSVTGRVARLAMIGAPSSGGQVLDEYALDLPGDATTDLADTIVGTYRSVAESGSRVAATRLCLGNAVQGDFLRQQVLGAGVENVEVVSEADAAAALARSLGVDAALLVADDDTVSLTVLGEDAESTSVLGSLPIGSAGAAVACATMLQRVPAGVAPLRVMLVGQRLDLNSVAAELSSTTPVQVPPDAGYAIARGAAQTVDAAGFAPVAAATQLAIPVDATQMATVSAEATQMAPIAAPAAPATAAGAAVGPELAYSQAPEDGSLPMEAEYTEMPMDPLGEFVPEQEDQADYTTAIAPPPPRMILIGSAAAFLLISFATLAVTVAVHVRPAADVSAQPVPAVQSDTVPGRYLPPVPHEPDPVALPVAVLTPAPAAPAVSAVPAAVPNDRPVIEAPVAPPALPAPPPAVVPAPAPAPIGVPPIPLPLPPIIIVPPLNPPWTPPTWTPPTTVTSTVTTTPPTTTTTPPTTTTTPPTTTPPTTTTTVPTTTTAPPTTTTEPPTTTEAPVTTTVPPTTVTPEPPVTQAPVEPAPVTQAPVEQAPATQAPVVTQQPSSSGGGESSGSSRSSGGESSGGSSSSGGGSVEAPVTTVPLSP